jgi:putative two-component system response regulator
MCKPVHPEGLQLTVAGVLRRRQLELRVAKVRDQIDSTIETRLSDVARVRRALLGAMCRMGEFRDAEPHAHPERVARYSRAIARRLSVSSPYAPAVDEAFMQNVFECAPLHDIGKVGVPDGVLLKPTRLAPAEMSIMQTHATIGRDICQTVKREIDGNGSGFIDMAIEITGCHHERWDGEGYPQGLKGADIPLSARIVGLADFYDACRSATVYRAEPLPRESVLALVEKWTGARFDPAVVSAFRLCDAEAREIEASAG